jgi:hypothetical protein
MSGGQARRGMQGSNQLRKNSLRNSNVTARSRHSIAEITNNSHIVKTKPSLGSNVVTRDLFLGYEPVYSCVPEVVRPSNCGHKCPTYIQIYERE